ncbi:MAG: hypothetical protein WC565_05110 [Parcubacteria group bacterium]
MAAKPAPPALDRERLARIIVDALDMGDKLAAENAGVCVRSVERYRSKMAEDPELAALVAEKRKSANAISEEAWHKTRVRFLRSAVAKLEELVADAKPTQIRLVAGAIKIVGELHTEAITFAAAGDGLDERDSGAQPSAKPPSNAQGADRGEAATPVH